MAPLLQLAHASAAVLKAVEDFTINSCALCCCDRSG